jgi:hypothetical protein
METKNMSGKASPLIAFSLLCSALLVFLAMGCSSAVSTNTADYVGEYVSRPFNSNISPFADFLILKADSKAVEIRVSRNSGQVTTTEATWSLDRKGTDVALAIGDFSHPIEGRGAKIKLHNNYDLGMYYEKVR